MSENNQQKDEITDYPKKFATIFFWASLLCMGAVSLWATQSTDLTSLLFAAKQVLPPALLLTCIGYFIGKIVDKNNETKSEPVQKLKY